MASENMENLVNRRYEHGFVTDIETESLPPGLDEDVVRAISARKNEPEFMLEWRRLTRFSMFAVLAVHGDASMSPYAEPWTTSLSVICC